MLGRRFGFLGLFLASSAQFPPQRYIKQALICDSNGSGGVDTPVRDLPMVYFSDVRRDPLGIAGIIHKIVKAHLAQCLPRVRVPTVAESTRMDT